MLRNDRSRGWLPLRLGSGGLVGLTLAALLSAQRNAWPQRATEQVWFEFGTVASLGKGSVEIRALNQADPRRPVQRSYLLTLKTRADLVYPGDAVEMIYTQESGGLRLLRLVRLAAGFPQAGPPALEDQAALDAGLVRPGAGGGVSYHSTGEIPVNLGVNNTPKPAVATAVPLGSNAKAKPLAPITVAREMPAEECNRSSAEWPSQPLTIAVIDFRYPTEKEEAHDLSRTGGGSGTAVADLVFARLSGMQTEFAIDRGDRRRLDRTDFAGAARLGRQLGVDAVLAGTFAPVQETQPAEDGLPRPREYQLHAGLVDTCTGQLLMKLSSDQCSVASCAIDPLTAKEAEDPKGYMQAFARPIDALLYPLEHNGGLGLAGDAGGVVTAMAANDATLLLPKGVKVKAGDQVAIHASRLVKNPSTYTLQDLHDEEIGRVIVSRVAGTVATGIFSGDIAPRAGDTVKLVEGERAAASN